jgi:YjjG family noncanonical pyrimidine nucleotidase
VRYTTVLFDLDHTLLDSDASEAAAFDLTMRSVGIDPTAEVFAAYDRLNQALWRRVEAGELSANDVKVRRFEQLLHHLDAVGDPVEMGATFVGGLVDHGELYDGAARLLAGLAATCRLALVTNGIGAVQRGRLARLGLEGVFEVVSISGELGVSKPDRTIFDFTLDAMGIGDRRSVVMIGDNLASDIQGGINAGVDTIWFDADGAVVPDGTAPTHRASAFDAVADIVTRQRAVGHGDAG